MCRAVVDRLQFLIRFHVEHQDAGFKGKIDLILPFADPGIDDLAGIDAGLQGAVELSAGDEIHTAPLPDEEPKDRRVRIGLDGKADDVGNLRKGRVKNPEMVQERPVAVEIKGGAHLPGDLRNRNLFAEELVILIIEVIHRSLFFLSSIRRAFSSFLPEPLGGSGRLPAVPPGIARRYPV